MGAQLGSVAAAQASAPAGAAAAGSMRWPSGLSAIYWTSGRAMIARAIMLTTRVIPKRTRPEAIRVLTARPEDSGKLSAMLAAIVDGFAWLIRLKVTTPETERMIVDRHRLAERPAEPEHRRR